MPILTRALFGSPIPVGGVGEDNTGVNLGAGSQVFAQKNGVALEFRTLTGSAGVALTQTATEIDINGLLLLPLDGSRAMTGPLNMAAQAITNAGAVASTGFSGPLAGNVNGVSILTDGPATQYLDRTGNYSVPISAASLQTAFDAGNIIDVTAARPLLFRGTTALNVSPLNVQMDAGAGFLDVLQIDGLGGVNINPIVDKNFVVVTTGNADIDLISGLTISLVANNSIAISSTIGEIVFLTGSTVRFVVRPAGNVGIGTQFPDAGALLELDSTTRALLLTRQNTAQRDLIAAVAGMVIFNTTTLQHETFNGTVWEGTGTGTESLQGAYNGGPAVAMVSTTGNVVWNATDAVSWAIQKAAANVIAMDVDGEVNITPPSGQSFNVSTSGVSGIGLTGNNAVDLESTIGGVTLGTAGIPRLIVDNAGGVRIGGLGAPNELLHVNASGTSGYTSGAERGILITDSVGPRVVFEDTGETAGARVMAIRYEGQSLTLFALNDVGNAITQDNIIVANRDGQVTIGSSLIVNGNVGFGVDPGTAKFVIRQAGQNRFSVDANGAIQLFAASGEDIDILGGASADVTIRASGPEGAGDFPGILKLEGGGGGDIGPGGRVDVLGGPGKIVSSNPGGPVNVIAGTGGFQDGPGGVGTVAGGLGGGTDGDGGLQIVRGGLGTGTGVDGELHLSTLGATTRVLGDLIIAGTATVGGSPVVVETRTLTAGAGLTGGGDLSSNLTFDVVATDPSIVVSANSIGVGVLQSDAMHGLRGGGTQHAVATLSVDGFMSAADKTSFNLGLFGAYQNGNTVGVTSANGTIEFDNTTDTADVLRISRANAGLGNGLGISMAAGATGEALNIFSSLGSSAKGLVIDLLGSGEPLRITQSSSPRLVVDGAGAISLLSADGEALSLASGNSVALSGILTIATGDVTDDFATPGLLSILGGASIGADGQGGFLQFTGGTGTTAGGGVNITGGTATVSGPGADVVFTGGQGAAGGAGGQSIVQGGTPGTNADGGGVIVRSSAGNGTGGPGAVDIQVAGVPRITAFGAGGIQLSADINQSVLATGGSVSLVAVTGDITLAAGVGAIEFTQGINDRIVVDAAGAIAFTSGPGEPINILGDSGVKIGAGTLVSPLHFFYDSTADNATTGFTIEQTNVGGNVMLHLVDQSARFVIGTDNSNENELRISPGPFINSSVGMNMDATTGNVAMGNTTANSAAVLTLGSQTKGFLPTRMTTTQMNAISGASAGMIVYDNTTNELNVRGPSAFAPLGDFFGPSVAVSGNLVSFGDTTGKLGADSGIVASTLSGGPFLPLAGGTMSGPINMGTQAITNAGPITVEGGSSDVRIKINTTGANPALVLTSIGQQDWSLGIDQGDSGKLKIGASTAVGANTRFTLESGGNVGLGTPDPDSRVHIFDGSAGAVTAIAQTGLTLENSIDTYINFLVPDANAGGIFFGRGTVNNDGGFFYNATVPQGFEFRTGGNNTRMVIDSVGKVAMGTDTPDTSALLHLESTDKGILPPRNANPAANIPSPATGLLAYDTTTDALNVRTATPAVWNRIVVESFLTTGVLFDGSSGTLFLHTAGAGVFETPTGATITIPATAPTGTYIIGLDFEWGYNTATSNFLSHLLQGATAIMEHSEEPADSGGSGGVVDGSGMIMHMGRKRPIDFTTGTAVTFTFQFAPEATADCAVRRVSLTVERKL